MKKLPFIISLVLNVVLIVALVTFHRIHRRVVFKTASNFTAAEVRLQEHILKELGSGEQDKIEHVKTMLRNNIENGRKVASDLREAATW